MTEAVARKLSEAGCAALGLTLSDESRAAVEANLAILLQRAADVAAFRLDDAADPAPLLRL